MTDHNSLSTRMMSRQLKLELQLEYSYKQVGRYYITNCGKGYKFKHAVSKAQGLRLEIISLQAAKAEILKAGGCE